MIYIVDGADPSQSRRMEADMTRKGWYH